MYPSPAIGRGGASTCTSSSWARSALAISTARLNAARDAGEKSVGWRIRRTRLMISLLWKPTAQSRRRTSSLDTSRPPGGARQDQSVRATTTQVESRARPAAPSISKDPPITVDTKALHAFSQRPSAPLAQPLRQELG